MIQPVALGERISTLHTALLRLLRLVETVPAYSFPDPAERQITIDVAKDALSQHRAYETPFKP